MKNAPSQLSEKLVKKRGSRILSEGVSRKGGKKRKRKDAKKKQR
jgi:hypothetical protein